MFSVVDIRGISLSTMRTDKTTNTRERTCFSSDLSLCLVVVCRLRGQSGELSALCSCLVADGLGSEVGVRGERAGHDPNTHSVGRRPETLTTTCHPPHREPSNSVCVCDIGHVNMVVIVNTNLLLKGYCEILSMKWSLMNSWTPFSCLCVQYEGRGSSAGQC